MGSGRVLSLTEWKKLQTPDVYFTPEYYSTSALADSDAASSLLIEWKDEAGTVYLPLLLRAIHGTPYLDATSAYGYGGPWTYGNPDLTNFRSFYDEWALNNHVVASFLRFHPLLENALDFKEIFPLKLVGPTAAWDLDDSESLVEGMAKNHRKNWRRAVRAGVEARLTLGPKEVNDFRDLYEKSMARLSASSSYWLPEAYWNSLRDELGGKSLLVEAIHDDQVVAAAWCFITDRYLHFHLSGTSDEGRRIGGAYVCRVGAAQWAKDAGLTMAHHGGGAGGARSTLLDWKAKFDTTASLRDFYVAEIIHNHVVFDDLCQGYPRDGFFPPWRHPSHRLVRAR